MNNRNVLVIGCGYMAGEYLKILRDLKYNAIIIGRGLDNIGKMKEKYPEFLYYSGGLQEYIKTNSNYPDIAINTVNVEFLKDTTEQLLNIGIKKILLEKPGCLDVNGLEEIESLEKEKEAQVFVAYNRRYYSSILELEKQLSLDGGILSANFEFTEWIHTIDYKQYNKEALNRWIIANSSHVIDTVFYLIGFPKLMNCIVLGQNSIQWHPCGSIFIGSGLSDQEIPFTYNTNWLAPGRWSIEIFTRNRRFYLKPMELLQIQNIGSVNVQSVEFDDLLDKKFKPGLYLQTKAFLEGDYSRFCTIEQQKDHIDKVYNKMSGYEM